MESQNRSDIEARISEIERAIKEFNEKFDKGTSDSENFITMDEIERPVFLPKGGGGFGARELGSIRDFIKSAEIS